MHEQAFHQTGSDACMANADAFCPNKRRISTRLESTKLGIKAAEYKLSKLIDFENFHTALRADLP